MEEAKLLALYRAMVMARQVDAIEQQLVSRGEAFFHVSGAGHEASAALAFHLNDVDWLHCHYRDKALMIARGVTPRSFLDSLLCKHSSHSRGRQMSAHMSEPDLKILSISGPVGNNALHAVGVAAAVKDRDGQPIVVCSVGDGTTQEGEFLEACAEAVRCHVPVLFLVEDNGWAISTTTRQKTFYSLPNGNATTFHGMPLTRIDGRDAINAYERLGTIVCEMRDHRSPQLVIFEVERLHSHTNADDQGIYREACEILLAGEKGDPITRIRHYLLQHGCSESVLTEVDRRVGAEAEVAEREALSSSDPDPAFTAKSPLRVELTHPTSECRGQDNGGMRLPMKDAMREVLRKQLREDARVSLDGQDIEDPKGDVFGVTKGLSTEFPGRVRNSPLAEATIIGTAIGRALAGERPVAFLQFADFLPLAYNQIASEMGSMYWRTDGGWQSPVIVMIPCGGYRPGLGPFHSHSFESIAVHTPGVDVYMPATATDAAGLLNAAFASQRPTLFFYPKGCLNDPETTAPADVNNIYVPIGAARKLRSGRDITFVAWGNTVRLCERAAETLDEAGIESEIFDLRCLSPWDEHAILASAEKTARLVVVHEDNHTCGLGAEVLATVAEKARMPVAVCRVTRSDTYVPCNFANQLEILPSYKRVLETAGELLDLEVNWTAPPRTEPGRFTIEAVGSGPSDETVTVVELHVSPGKQIRCGDAVATLEATKSVFELTSPVSGTVEQVLISDGETVNVGTGILSIDTENAPIRPRPPTRENPGTPVITRKRKTGTLVIPPPRPAERRRSLVGVSSVAAVTGSRRITNEDLARQYTTMSPEDILRRTGIETRCWAAPGESAIDMAARACWQLLDQEGLIVDDLNVVICTTTSPTVVTPSMACQLLNRLASGKTAAMVQAYDINAACSGFLYALQAGYDYLQSAPQGRVLIVTAELLSPLLNLNDLDTAIIFGDAASATVLYGEQHVDLAKARLLRPELSAKADDGSVLSVPFPEHGFIQMQGRRVFSEAVRTMLSSLNRVCEFQEMTVDQLSLVVPHQANGRIIEAMRNRLEVEVFSNIRSHGNTSSTSIPLCLVDVFPRLQKNERIAVCAFGGGFTFGAGLLEAV